VVAKAAAAEAEKTMIKEKVQQEEAGGGIQEGPPGAATEVSA